MTWSWNLSVSLCKEPLWPCPALWYGHIHQHEFFSILFTQLLCSDCSACLDIWLHPNICEWGAWSRSVSIDLPLGGGWTNQNLHHCSWASYTDKTVLNGMVLCTPQNAAVLWIFSDSAAMFHLVTLVPHISQPGWMEKAYSHIYTNLTTSLGDQNPSPSPQPDPNTNCCSSRSQSHSCSPSPHIPNSSE